MLIVREEQMEALAQAPLMRFEDSMVEHVREFFAEQYRAAGEPAVREVIRYGIRQANGYGFTTEHDVCLYITVMLMVGSNFDSDTLHPWALEILDEDVEPDPSARAETLADKALEYATQLSGSDGAEINQAFARFLENHPRIIVEPPSGALDEHLVEHFKNIHPKKFATLGEPAIQQLIAWGVESGKAHGITESRGLVLYIFLMFLLGAHFDREPLLPWASSILTDPSADQTTTVDRLYEESRGFLERWLSSVDSGRG